ncbi:MAG: response regulator [Bacteroidota bacterium]
MSTTRILVIEDESIVAKDIQNTLIKLGYDVPVTASNAESAFIRLDEVDPDLVFLDVKLKGEVDGIQIAEKIRDHYEIPVIFLTSFVDKETLDRAKVTEPYGYLVKPFNEPDLRSTVEMALYKFAKDQETRNEKERYESALTNLDDSIITLDTDFKVTFMNPRAEEMIGVKLPMCEGGDLFEMVQLSCSSGQHYDRNSLHQQVVTDKALELNDAELKTASGKTSKVAVICSPVKDEKDNLVGYALVIRKSADSTSNVSSATAEPMTNVVIQNSFFVKKGSMLVKVFIDNINWIQAMDNYVTIQTGADHFIIHSTMKDIESKLPTNKFLRVHRSYIIAVDKINVLDENTVLIGEKTIPIGKSYKETFMNRLNFL